MVILSALFASKSSLSKQALGAALRSQLREAELCNSDIELPLASCIDPTMFAATVQNDNEFSIVGNDIEGGFEVEQQTSALEWQPSDDSIPAAQPSPPSPESDVVSDDLDMLLPQGEWLAVHARCRLAKNSAHPHIWIH